MRARVPLALGLKLPPEPLGLGVDLADGPAATADALEALGLADIGRQLLKHTGHLGQPTDHLVRGGIQPPPASLALFAGEAGRVGVLTTTNVGDQVTLLKPRRLCRGANRLSEIPK